MNQKVGAFNIEVLNKCENELNFEKLNFKRNFNKHLKRFRPQNEN